MPPRLGAQPHVVDFAPCSARHPHQVTRIVKEQNSSNDESRGKKKPRLHEPTGAFSIPGRKAQCGQPSDSLFVRLSNQISSDIACPVIFLGPSEAAIVRPYEAAIKKCAVVRRMCKRIARSLTRVTGRKIVSKRFHSAAQSTLVSLHCQLSLSFGSPRGCNVPQQLYVEANAFYVVSHRDPFVRAVNSFQIL